MRHTRIPPGPSGTTAEFYQPTMFSRKKIRTNRSIENLRILATPSSDPNYGNPFPTGNMGPSGFFSPQTAFYAPTNPTMNNAIPGMEFLSNNPLLNVGFNAVEQGVKDFTNRTVSQLIKRNEFVRWKKKKQISFRLKHLCRRSNIILPSIKVTWWKNYFYYFFRFDHE